MPGKWLLISYMGLLGLGLPSPSWSQVPDPLVGITSWGESGSWTQVALTQSGNVFVSGYASPEAVQAPWVPQANLFTSAGAGVRRIVAVSTGRVLAALADDGTLFYGAGNRFNGIHWQVGENVAGSAGVPGALFVGLWVGSPNNQEFWYALTASGAVFRKNNLISGGPWEVAGSLFDSPTPVDQSTWGAVKVRYRR